MLFDFPIELITLEDSSYHLMIEVLFPNNMPGNLIIDTGASKTVFDTSFVESFIIDIQPIENQKSSGINSMITEAQTGTIPSMYFGAIEIKNFETILLDLSHINNLYQQYSDKKIAGLMGSDFLLNHEAIIDYHQSKITLNL